MYTIQDTFTKEVIIKNSRFIAIASFVESLEDVSSFLRDVKESYPKATHYTYAYRFLDIERSSDDGEPGGTAGMPILNVLEKQEIIYTIVVVVRYFGGIKLGAGGLVRAYSKACREVLDISQKIELIPAFKVLIHADYSKVKELDYLLKSSVILEKKFTDDVCYLALLDNINILEGHFSYEVIGEGYIKKEL